MALYLLLYRILLCSFLGPFCLDAKEPDIVPGHAKTGEAPEVPRSLEWLGCSMSTGHSLGGMTRPGSWGASLSSSAGLSPLLRAEGSGGKRMSLERYCFRFALHSSLQGSGGLALPSWIHWDPNGLSNRVDASHRVDASKSSKLKPLPACTLVWCLPLGPKSLDAGCGATVPALACLGFVSADLLPQRVEPRGHRPLPVLVELELQDPALALWLLPVAYSEGEQPTEKNRCCRAPWDGTGSLFQNQKYNDKINRYIYLNKLEDNNVSCVEKSRR